MTRKKLSDVIKEIKIFMSIKWIKDEKRKLTEKEMEYIKNL
jgi:hypothetical protein